MSSGDVVELSSRVGTTRLTALVSERMPAGVVYTTFHHPVTGANVVTTENSDWATNCPEYKVTAVQVEVVTEAARAEASAARTGARRGDGRRHRGDGAAAMTGSPVPSGHGVPPVVRLGHDLVRNFEALPPDQAAVEIATHIRKFWEPRMRQELLARIRWGDTTPAPAAGARRRGPRRRRRRPLRGQGALRRVAAPRVEGSLTGGRRASAAALDLGGGAVAPGDSARIGGTSMAAIEVTGLRKVYGGVAAVDGLDLTVGEGEVVALLGPNGAGKTTTVEILEGYRARDAGTVSVLGHDPQTGGRSFRERIGIVLQEAGFEENFTPRELIRLHAGYYPHPRPVAEVHHPDRPGREGRRPGGHALGWPEAPPRPRARHRRRPRPALPRRADHRLRPLRPAPRLGPRAEPARPRRHDPADHALPRRGRAPRRPGRRHRPRPGASPRARPRSSPPPPERPPSSPSGCRPVSTAPTCPRSASTAASRAASSRCAPRRRRQTSPPSRPGRSRAAWSSTR